MPNIPGMGITRDKLYKEVWAEPMVRVAVRHGVSANYLARVCHCLNVPYPHLVHWAKRRFRRAPTRPALADPRPGEVLESGDDPTDPTNCVLRRTLDHGEAQGLRVATGS